MKIKAFLLGLVLVLFCVSSFSSAKNYVFSSDSVSVCPLNDSCYTPSIVYLSGNYVSSSFVCNNSNGMGCSIIFLNSENFDDRCDINDSVNNCESFNGTYSVFGPPFDEGTLSYSKFNLVLDGEDDNGGDMDLIDELSPVITGLNSTMSEFIPYVVYIGLGVLGVVIGFFAIKRLLRYVRRSALSPFKSRKRF